MNAPTRILPRYDTQAKWASKNPKLGPGELGVESDTNRFKLGDGNRRWLELSYFVDDATVHDLIAQAIEDAGAGSGDGGVALAAHIASLTPHPVYDDGPSLVLLYQNAKV